MLAQRLRHVEMVQHIVGRIGFQVALRQSIEKRFHSLARSWRQRAQVNNLLVMYISVRVQALVNIATQLVRGGNVELPNIFSLPWRQRVRINGFDVRVSKQAEHLKPLGGSNFFGEYSHGGRIEDIAAKRRRHFEMIANQK